MEYFYLVRTAGCADFRFGVTGNPEERLEMYRSLHPEGFERAAFFRHPRPSEVEKAVQTYLAGRGCLMFHWDTGLPSEVARAGAEDCDLLGAHQLAVSMGAELCAKTPVTAKHGCPRRLESAPPGGTPAPAAPRVFGEEELEDLCVVGLLEVRDYFARLEPGKRLVEAVRYVFFNPDSPRNHTIVKKSLRRRIALTMSRLGRWHATNYASAYDVMLMRGLEFCALNGFDAFSATHDPMVRVGIFDLLANAESYRAGPVADGAERPPDFR